jgi:TP901 family phage tail tape measure protein
LSRIELNIVATGNFKGVETSIARLRSQVDSLNASMMGLGFNASIGKSVSSFQDQFNSAIDTSGMFERHMVNLTSETTRFGRALESGNMRIGQLFKAATEYRRGELGQIRQLAREQVRLMNSATMRMPDGATQVIVPRGIDAGIEKQRILNQEYRIFRQVVANGSTEIINWGKNTQWAGRQLTVGLTVPLTIFGAAAGKMFMNADKQLTRLTKVYGDAAKGMVDPAELQRIRKDTLGLAQDIASSMGVAVEETLGIAADLAATGKEGNDLLAATSEAMRLSVLGEVERQEAMRATISIQSVFKKDTEGLAESINFLNAVENQTSTTLDDLVTGIVKAGPVVQGLGGDIEDLSAMMVAMREGGVSAAEAANAIKSSLASLINPTKQTTDLLGGFGIDIKNIVDKNAGDVVGTLTDLQSALSGLDDLSRQRSIEQIFGKFQFSRINALLANLGRAGSQTEQVFAIAGMSVEELAKNADNELRQVTESITGRFQRAFEGLKANLIPIGETFVTVGTMLINVGNKVLDIFNSIPEPIKNIVKGMLGVTAAIGPIIMITGVLGNFFGYLIKGVSTILAFKKEGRGAFEMLSVDSIAARDATELLSESLYDQSTAMGTMASAVDTLVKKLQELVNQLNHARGASTSLDNVAQGVLANAEAAAIVRTGPATAYTTPVIPWKRPDTTRHRYTGREDVNATYSHLTPSSMFDMPGVMGLGAFVDEGGSDVQKRLKNFYSDLLLLREETVDSVFRRDMLAGFARDIHGSGPELDKTIAQIKALTDEQLAQILPSWEKITAQSTEYFSIISVASEQAAAGITTAKEAFEQYGRDITEGIVSPEDALQKLRKSINDVDGAVDKRVLDIRKTFEEIEQEFASMPAGRDRAVALATRVKEKIIDPYEIAAVKRNATLDATSQIPGLGKDGLRNPLLHAIQMYTDQIFNNIQSSEELVNAANEVSEAMSNLQSSLSNAKSALDKSDDASKKLQDAELSAAAALKKAYPSGYKNMDIANAIIRQPGPQEAGTAKWVIGDKEVKNQALIDALNRRQLALEEVTRADLALADASENVLTSEQLLMQKTSELARRKEIEIEISAASATGNQSLIDATRRVAELREAEAQSIIEKSSAEDQHTAAVKEEAAARAALAEAEKVRAKELLAGSARGNRATADAAVQAAKQRLTKAEVDLALATERKRMASITGIKATNELSEEELQLAVLRERQSLEVVENTASTQRNTNSTDEGTMVREGHTGAIVGNKGATERDSKGILRGGKLGSMISMASMVAMFLPRPGEDTGAGQAMNAGINIANMTGMGAMFGGPGIAIGASLGLAVEGIKFLGRKSEEAAIELEKIRASSLALKSGLTELERSFFQADPLKDLGDTALNAFRLKTEEATSRLKEFARAVKEAEQGSPEAGRRDAISQMSNAEEFINDPMFAKMVSQALLGGMDVEDIKVMIGGYLDAADKEVFAPLVNEEITRIGKLGKRPEEIGARYIADLQNIANRVISGAGYSDYQESGLRSAQMQYENARRNRSVQAIDPETKEFVDANTADMAIYFQDIAKQFGMSVQQLLILLQQELASPTETGPINPAVEAAMRGITLDGISTGEDFRKFISDIAPALQQLVAISPDLVNIKDVMGAIGNEAQLFADGITNALGSGRENFDEFLNSLGNTAESMNENAQLASEMGARIGQISPSAKTAFEVMISNGVELQDALRIVSMLISDAGTDWAQLADLARSNPADFRLKIWTEYVSGGTPTPGSVPAQGATAPDGVGSRLAGAIDYSGGSGGSGGSGSDYYDKLIEAQDKIIEGIQKEREERQKLLDIQEKQMDFALRRQDLENQIARALAEGNLAEASLLQAQLDAEQKKYDNDEIERKTQEKEDKRIEAAEKEKERLQKLKDASSGGGGGGSSGGVSESQKQWTANRIDILSSGVVNWTEGAELRARTGEMGPWSAFFESDKVKKYREELIKLGVPIEDINRELNSMFDSWIDNNSALFAQTDDYKFIEDSLKSMGIEGDRLKEVMPDAFGALLDKELNPKEKIDIIADALYDLGYETDEAYRKAKKLYNQYGEDFDGKGIDDEIARWIAWNDRIKEVNKQLKRNYERVEETQFAYNNSAFPYGAPQTSDITGMGGTTNPNTINAGGVQIDAQQTGIDMLGGVVQGWTGSKEKASTTIQGVAKFLLDEFAEEAGTNSPSWKYELIGKDMIAGLMNGLVLKNDSSAEIISSINDTFREAVDSYRVMFTDPASGISGVLGEEVKTASDNFYTSMTERMQDTVNEINNILKTNLKDYVFNIIGNPKIYDGGARSLWQRVFEGIPSSMFTTEMPKYASGGYVSGPGGPTEDKIPAMLSDGEYVIRASSVDQYGTGLLDMINARKFYTGGYVSADRAEYNASRRPTYFGGTPTSSTGYNRPAPTYYGGTPTYPGGYTSAYATQATTPRQIGPANELNMPYTGSGLISYGGGNYAWDTTRGKYVKIANTRTGAAASGFSIMGSALSQSINKFGLWGTLTGVGDHIRQDPSQLLPFVGSNKIDTSTPQGKDLFAASSLLDIASLLPISFLPATAIRGSAAVSRSISSGANIAIQDGIPIIIDSSLSSQENIPGLERPLPPAPAPYIRPTLRPTSEQIKQAMESGIFNLRNVPEVPYPFDPRDPSSSTVGVPFATGRDRRVGIFPKGTRPRAHDEPTDYGPNGRVVQGYTDAWALYVAMSSNDLTGETYHPNSVRQGPGMKDVQDILPEYHTMGPARARGFNYGLIKIFGNIENAIRWGIKPMAIDPNPTLEEVPGSRPYDDPEAPAQLRYRNPGMSIDTEVYPSNWDQMSTEEKILYKTGRVLGYNKGLGYTTEKSLRDLPELGRVPFIIDSMIAEYETTPLGLASKLASDKVPTFSFNKQSGIQNDFAAYQDPSGRVWSNREILNNRKEFPVPIYPAAPGPEKLNPFQTAVQNAVDTASIATGMSDLVAKYVIRGAIGAIFPDDPKGAGFRSAIQKFANGEIDLPTAAILGAVSSFNPTVSEIEIMKPSNWAEWNSDPIYSKEWMKQFVHLTGQKDEFGNPIPNQVSKPGIPIGTLGSTYPTSRDGRGTPLRPVPKRTTFADWGTGVPRAPGFPTWGSGVKRGFPHWGMSPGFPTWGTGSNRSTYPSRSGPVRGYGSALDGNAMTPRLYSAYLRAKSQGRENYAAPLVNPFINDATASPISGTPEAQRELAFSRGMSEITDSLNIYSPEFLEQLLGIELDPSSRLTVDNLIKLGRVPTELLTKEQYLEWGGIEGSAGAYSSDGRRIGINTSSPAQIINPDGKPSPNPRHPEDILRTLHHELRHAQSDLLLGGVDRLGRSYAQGNVNPFFNQSFRGIVGSNTLTGNKGSSNPYFDDKGNSYGRGIEEASAANAELIIMKKLKGSGFDVTTDGRPLYTQSPEKLPYNMLNGQLSYQALHYLTHMNNPNSVLSKDEMKYLNTQTWKQFVDNMDGRIDVPKNLNPLELAYHYAPTSVRERMLKLNPNLKAAWTGKKGGMVRRFAEGGLVRVGKENLTVLGEGISDYARQFTGTPYSSSAAWADGPANGWGCATATKWLYDSYAGMDVGHPSLSAAQYASGSGSQVSSALPGDLMFFYYPNGVNTGNPINHVGMSLGNGSMFHARSEALGTQITGIDELGMDRARARAGGTAIKRYLPMTIAGMGLPTAQFKMGGKVYGEGGPTSDDILALISNGEYVMNAGAVSHYGKDFMDAVNKGILPEAAMGGMLSSKYPGYVQNMGDSGMLSRKFGGQENTTSNSNVEYNINVNVAGTNASPDEIANKVMQTIKRSDKMKGAVIRI